MAVAPLVVLFSSHLYRQRRRGGFHWIADALHAAGWRVRFVTVDYSLMTLLKGDRRTRYGQAIGINRLETLAPGLEVAVLKTATHPIGTGQGLSNRLLRKLTARYPGPALNRIMQWSQGADLLLFESNSSLHFVPALRAASTAVQVYRVSDNLATIRPLPSLLAAEAAAIKLVDVVSVASPILARSFDHVDHVRIDPMGLDNSAFNTEFISPYPKDGRVRVICSGTSSLDTTAFATAAAAFPDWDFILVGSAAELPVGANIITTGEIPFTSVVPLVKFADIGFAPYLVRPGFAYQAEHSNRLLQYTYSRLPSVVPDALCSPQRRHFFGYAPDAADSLVKAFHDAHAFERTSVPVEDVISWTELAGRIAASKRRH